jgi:hypothetical protein
MGHPRVPFGSPEWIHIGPQGAPVCILAANWVTQGFYFDHPNGYILVTQEFQFVSNRPWWPPKGSILVTQMDPYWSPNGLQFASKRPLRSPTASILVTETDPRWSPNGPQFASKRPCWSPKGPIFITQMDPYWSPKCSSLHPRGRVGHPMIPF